MASVHYFQRYAQRENVVTNNTLLLLSRLHHDGPAAFERLLGLLLDDVEISVGPTFRQQEGGRGGRGSVPDGAIYQPSFRVLVETKRTAASDADQLERHLHRFEHEDTQILLHLTPHATTPEFDADVEARVLSHNREHGQRARYVAVTFTDLVAAVDDVLADHDYEMRELLDDFEAYCSAEGLLPSNPYKLRIVACGETLDENVRYGLYYHQASRGYSSLGYLGAYKEKSVRAIGAVRNEVTASVRDGTVEIISAIEPPSEADVAAIAAAVSDGESNHGYTFADDHIFFFVDRFHETDFRKRSKYGMMKERHFDLRAVLGTPELPDTATIARRLRDVSWEEASQMPLPSR